MKLVVEASHLNRILSFVKGCIPSKSTLPILQHVLLCADGSTLTVRATNLEREAEASCPAHIDDSALFTLPGELLCAIVSNLPQGAQIGFSKKAGDRIEIVSGSSKFTLRALEPQDFPTLSGAIEEGSATFNIDAKKFANLLSAVVYASEKDIIVRPELYGVHLYVENKKLIAVSSDMKRFARREIDAPSGAETMQSFLLPEEATHRICGTLKELGEDVTLKIGGALVEFTTETLRLTVRLMDKKLPEYLKVKMASAEADFTVHPGVFKDAIERTQQVYAHASEKVKYQEAKLKASDGTLTISMGDTEKERGTEEVEATVNVAKSVCVDCRYLSDMLKGWPEDGEIDVFQSKAGAPIFFTTKKHPDLCAMIAPMQAKRAKEEKEAA